MGLSSITARRPLTIAVRQVVIEKLRHSLLIEPAQIEPTSLRPSQEMERKPTVGMYGAPSVTALDQIPLERVGAWPISGSLTTSRGRSFVTVESIVVS
jgi:hypothetical protein